MKYIIKYIIKYIMFVMIIFNNECNITSLLILLNDIEELHNVNKINFCLADIIYRFHNQDKRMNEQFVNIASFC